LVEFAKDLKAEQRPNAYTLSCGAIFAADELVGQYRQMLCLHFSLQPSDSSAFSQFLESRRFLADAFHSWLKQALREHAPGVYSALRPSESGPALYSLFCEHEFADGVSLVNVRFALLGTATTCANELVVFFTTVDTVDFGNATCSFVPKSLEASTPGHEHINLSNVKTGRYDVMPDDWLRSASVTELPTVEPEGVESVGLQVLSALRIGQLPASEVPSMAQIVKVLLRKVNDCEPQTAMLLQSESAPWKEQIKALRTCALTSADIKESAWIYQSDNQAAHTRSGWVGLVQYEGNIGPQVLQLLWLGQWLGIGQNTSGGQGAYQLVTE
jgi:CRISPR-associated endoribonuclease Cas6